MCPQHTAGPSWGCRPGSTHLRAACFHPVYPMGKVVGELDGLRTDHVVKGRPTWAQREETKPWVSFQSRASKAKPSLSWDKS